MIDATATPQCPHCGEPMRAVPAPRQHRAGTRRVQFACFNDECPYFVRGWAWMFEHYGVKASYRYRVDPVTGHGSPLPVWSVDALKDRILDDDGDAARLTPDHRQDRSEESHSARAPESARGAEEEPAARTRRAFPVRLPPRRPVLQRLLRRRQHRPHPARRAAPSAADRPDHLRVPRQAHPDADHQGPEPAGGDAEDERRRRPSAARSSASRAARSTRTGRGRAACTRSAWRCRRRAPASSPSRSTSCSRTTSATAAAGSRRVDRRRSGGTTRACSSTRRSRPGSGDRVAPLVHRRPTARPQADGDVPHRVLRPRPLPRASSSSRAFLARFELPSARGRGDARPTTRRCSRFAFRWLRFALFGEPTMKVRGGAPSPRRSR